ncbi:DUF4172 domain-containing protein [Vibrio cincinnatiensis]|nr:DUF4172 domain-containing protein [Vibrio cincinnatiensis]
MWIWQQADWPNFIWDEKVIERLCCLNR